MPKLRGGYYRGSSAYYDFYINGTRYGPKSLGVIPPKLAQQQIDDLKASIRNGSYRKNDSISLEQMIIQYLDYSSTIHKPTTHKRAIYATKALVKYLPNDLSDINVRAIDHYKTIRKNDSRSNGTINNELRFLHAMLQKAMDWGYVKSVPKIDMLKDKATRTRFLTDAEEMLLLEHANPKLRDTIVFALNTGMRQTEIIHLIWNDIDFDQRLIIVERTKNNTLRSVPMNNKVYDLLQAKLSSRANNTGSNTDRIFGYTTGNQVRISFFYAAKVRAKLKDVTFHTCRHTFASRLVMKGVPLRTVQELLGHKSLAMTLRYSHLSKSAMSDAVSLL
jgi:integrase